MPVDPEAIRATRTGEFPEAYHEGVPNRDLPEGLWQTLSDELQAVLQTSPLFNVKSDAEMNEPAQSQPANEPS